MQLRETFLKSESMKSRNETYAAVRKALAQLDDPFTRFLGPQQYQVAYTEERCSGILVALLTSTTALRF